MCFDSFRFVGHVSAITCNDPSDEVQRYRTITLHQESHYELSYLPAECALESYRDVLPAVFRNNPKI